MNLVLTYHQQQGHTEMGLQFKVSSERPEKLGIGPAIPGLVVQCVIHYTTATAWAYFEYDPTTLCYVEE